MDVKNYKIDFPTTPPRFNPYQEGMYIFLNFKSKAQPQQSYTKATDEFMQIIKINKFSERIEKIRKEKGEMKFKNEKHKNHFYMILNEAKNFSPQYSAAVYLFTADKFLWKRCNGLIRNGKIRFQKMNIDEIGTQSYALFKAAKEIITGKCHIKAEELCNCKLIHDESFLLILNSFLICRNGIEIISAI